MKYADISLKIPAEILPKDGRFGAGPSKVRPEAVEQLKLRADLLGTSHRQTPIRNLVASIQEGLADLYDIPAEYEVILGNGGATLFWDLAIFSLINQRSSHAIFGEFSRKFAMATAQAPHLADPVITEAPAGTAILPAVDEVDVYAWPQNETSTGACAPVVRLSDDALILIDATSSAGGMPADISQTDVYYFSPQKNLASDGGMWFAFASPSAIERANRIKSAGRWIPSVLDFSLAITNSRQHQTLNTPAIVTLLLIEEQLAWLREIGGLAAASARCVQSSAILYDWAQQHPLIQPFVPSPYRSPVVVTLDLAPQISWLDLSSILRANGIFDVDPYRGLKRNQLRIATYASVDPDDVVALTQCLDFIFETLSA